MGNITWVERKSPVLKTSSLVCLASIPSINLTSGCANDCIYCYARGYSIFPGEYNVAIYQNTVDKLKNELLRKRNKPQAVYFSPSSDIFQPIPEVLEVTHSILEFLLTKDIGIAFLTKGQIPDKTLSLLLNNKEKVRAQIGIISYDDNIRQLFEPNAANIEARLQQMAKMIAGGIEVDARVIPIFPGITDANDAIDHLCSAIANTEVKQIAISTLFLRPAIVASLRRRISDKKTLDTLLSCYIDNKRIPIHAGHSSIIPLSKQKREEIYYRFRQAASKYRLNVSICGCMNPDIGGTCNITGKWPINKTKRSLFD